MSSGKVPVTFLNAYSGRKGLLGIAAFPDMLPGDNVFTRFFMHLDGQWGHADLDFDAKSVSYLINQAAQTRAWWVLGKNGEVAKVNSSGTELEQIPGAGLNWEDAYGYVETIKNIADELYVCGYGRQVYKRVDDDWISISDQILTHDKATGFFDMDGLDGNHIYAVGWQGEIYFYNGSEWLKDDSPTNSHLSTVCCLEDGTVWIAGNKGVVLRGSFNQWAEIRSDDFSDHWYGMAAFQGKIYLAANQSLAVVDGEEIVPLDVGLKKAITTNRLFTKEGLLWSVGEKDILVFDGEAWREILHPDNI
ncbi:MAG: hypothetical protein ABW104_18945 [Candidatus Thiodiazotropha sp. 6PLUC2]